MPRSLNLMDPNIEEIKPTNPVNRDHEIKRIIEALLFASTEALALDKIRTIVEKAFPVLPKEIKRLIEELANEYKEQKRGFQIDFIAGGYLLRSDPAMHSYIELLHRDRRGEKLSQAATEVLAIIAYRGPITRREVEKLRGVDSSATIISLLERGLVEEIGRLEAPGRPVQYSITQKFLHHFGINDVKELISN